MKFNKIKVNDIEIEYRINKNNICIKDSYKVKNRRDMEDILLTIATNDKWSSGRDRHINEWVDEWRAHNILYRIPLQYFKLHSGDCDLTNGESKFRLFVYSILGRF